MPLIRRINLSASAMMFCVAPECSTTPSITASALALMIVIGVLNWWVISAMTRFLTSALRLSCPAM
ncbi:membrane or secreted protein [Candidatus Magnetobacterium bavaricum]|uniref:Membrane or secreted protein n=1 Tax=Candidatus Magnetobacterium bavaricum TaxID=29290 RepID=A0A0F3GHV0_9BACT|nr:membrane or secreted protein [Candidatus Magnetobacterium bavaricum]